MARSRSSFELPSAIATASTLAKAEKKPLGIPTDVGQYRGSGLVSFQPTDAVAVPPPPAHDVTERPSSPPNHDGMDEHDAAPTDLADLAETSLRQAAGQPPKSVPALAIPPPPPSSTSQAAP